MTAASAMTRHLVSKPGMKRPLRPPWKPRLCCVALPALSGVAEDAPDRKKTACRRSAASSSSAPFGGPCRRRSSGSPSKNSFGPLRLGDRRQAGGDIPTLKSPRFLYRRSIPAGWMLTMSPHVCRSAVGLPADPDCCGRPAQARSPAGAGGRGRPSAYGGGPTRLEQAA